MIDEYFDSFEERRNASELDILFGRKTINDFMNSAIMDMARRGGR